MRILAYFSIFSLSCWHLIISIDWNKKNRGSFLMICTKSWQLLLIEFQIYFLKQNSWLFMNFYVIFSFSSLCWHLKILTDYGKIEAITSFSCGTTFDNYYLLNFQNNFFTPQKRSTLLYMAQAKTVQQLFYA